MNRVLEGEPGWLASGSSQLDGDADLFVHAVDLDGDTVASLEVVLRQLPGQPVTWAGIELTRGGAEALIASLQKVLAA